MTVAEGAPGPPESASADAPVPAVPVPRTDPVPRADPAAPAASAGGAPGADGARLAAPADQDRGTRGRPWLGYVTVAVCVVLGLVVLAQGMQLARLDDRLDRLHRNAAEAERSYERRLTQLEDRTDALTERVRRSLDSAAVAEHALPSVFQVVAGRSSGTAFAVARTDDGGTYLLTNQHVVEGVREGGTVRLTRESEKHHATLVEASVGNDVAVLETRAEIPVLRLATTPPVPGEPVAVVGAPVGLEDTMTTGVVSKIRPIAGRSQKYIQFDAAINPGNSGGPVLNAGGRVVGIATAKAMDAEGIGFALPIGVACDSFDFIC